MHHLKLVRTSAIMALLVTACGGAVSSAPKGVAFPTVPMGNEYPAGIIAGVLEERDGCIYVVRGPERYLLLWPEGWSARRVDGTLEVLDQDANHVGQAGDPIRLGGGGGAPDEIGGSGPEAWAEEISDEPIPDRCGSSFWIVSP